MATSKKVFALTFDDGPDPAYTPQFLALLKQYRVPATFFMVGSMVRAHPATALQVKAAGFPIENHSWSHPRTPKFPVAEITRTDAILLSTLGTRPTLFRPPYGLIGNGMASAAQKEGEKVVIWSCLGADWDKKNTPAQIAAKVLGRARSGGIALLHDGGGNRSRTLAALPTIIETLQARGFRLVTVPELLRLGTPKPASVSPVSPAATPSSSPLATPTAPVPNRTVAPTSIATASPTSQPIQELPLPKIQRDSG